MATGDSSARTLDGEPGGLSTLLRAALPAVPVVNQLPGIRKASADDFTGLAFHREQVVVERARVDAYAAVCGFPRKDVVPLTYPHLLAFPLHMAIMSDAAFPYPAIGMVHVENTITAHRAIGCRRGPRRHDVGRRPAPPRPGRPPGLRDHRVERRRDGMGVDVDLPAPRPYGRRRRRQPDW